MISLVDITICGKGNGKGKGNGGGNGGGSSSSSSSDSSNSYSDSDDDGNGGGGDVSLCDSAQTFTFGSFGANTTTRDFCDALFPIGQTTRQTENLFLVTLNLYCSEMYDSSGAIDGFNIQSRDPITDSADIDEIFGGASSTFGTPIISFDMDDEISFALIGLNDIAMKFIDTSANNTFEFSCSGVLPAGGVYDFVAPVRNIVGFSVSPNISGGVQGFSITAVIPPP